MYVLLSRWGTSHILPHTCRFMWLHVCSQSMPWNNKGSSSLIFCGSEAPVENVIETTAVLPWRNSYESQDHSIYIYIRYMCIRVAQDRNCALNLGRSNWTPVSKVMCPMMHLRLECLSSITCGVWLYTVEPRLRQVTAGKVHCSKCIPLQFAGTPGCGGT